MEDLSLKFTGQTNEFDFETQKKRLIENLNWFKSMKVEEFTFYKKWEELINIAEANVIKKKIWTPTDINNEELTIREIQNLNPRLIVVNDDEDKNWNTLRYYSHSAEHNNTPGRLIKFLLVTDVEQNFFGAETKILGFCSISSEMSSLKCRDEIIGWRKDIRMAKDGKGTLVNSMQCPCIAATQPFGYNFLGGKLMASMLTTSVVRNEYLKRYGDVLVGLTTTSLYGQSSMYNGMKWWDGVGTSAGKIPIQPSPEIYELWHNYIKKTDFDEYNKKMTQKIGISGPVTSPKLRVMQMIFRKVNLQLSKFNHGYARGCYYSCFYENGYSFLKGEITQDKLKMKPLFIGDTKAVLDWWKPRAIARYKKLKAENRLNSEILFYDKIKGLSYEKTKDIYFKDVGR